MVVILKTWVCPVSVLPVSAFLCLSFSPFPFHVILLCPSCLVSVSGLIPLLHKKFLDITIVDGSDESALFSDELIHSHSLMETILFAEKRLHVIFSTTDGKPLKSELKRFLQARDRSSFTFSFQYQGYPNKGKVSVFLVFCGFPTITPFLRLPDSLHSPSHPGGYGKDEIPRMLLPCMSRLLLERMHSFLLSQLLWRFQMLFGVEFLFWLIS
jgi:hypothetical protein